MSNLPCQEQAYHVQLVGSPLSSVQNHYFPSSQNGKVFKGWRVVTTLEVFLERCWFVVVNLYL